ncbi:MAG: L-seryl-tRNA(Sec) selenium transferase [Nocardioidaceae bacterium]
MDDPRRRVPATHELLGDPRLVEARRRLGAAVVKAAVRAAQETCRRGDLATRDVADAAVAALPRASSSLRKVLNATGVLVHTNLGRAPLSTAATQALTEAAGATDVELDLSTGRRAGRGRGALAALAAAVPDAEAVHVVNNGAAALALVTAALAGGREVVVARGELVEIGDGFRIPELLESAGARLREVGTTNRVSREDYAAAIGPSTGFLLKVHPSNFVVSGFTSAVRVEALATLPALVVADIGSGLLAPHLRLPDEPDAASALRAGADVVTASGDKLLGGPQCGLLLGSAELVHRARRHPLARALRVDKLTFAALEATLCGPVPPVLAALGADPDALLGRCRSIAAALAHAGVAARAERSLAVVGGGGAPGVELASAAVCLPAGLADRLRIGDPPVLGRVEHGQLLLDVAAVDPADDEELARAVVAAARAVANGPQTPPPGRTAAPSSGRA